LKVVGLFSGIGAFEFAAEQAGHEVLAAYEIDPVAVRWHLEAIAALDRGMYPVYGVDVCEVPAIPRVGWL